MTKFCICPTNFDQFTDMFHAIIGHMSDQSRSIICSPVIISIIGAQTLQTRLIKKEFLFIEFMRAVEGEILLGTARHRLNNVPETAIPSVK